MIKVMFSLRVDCQPLDFNTEASLKTYELTIMDYDENSLAPMAAISARMVPPVLTAPMAAVPASMELFELVILTKVAPTPQGSSYSNLMVRA